MIFEILIYSVLFPSGHLAPVGVSSHPMLCTSAAPCILTYDNWGQHRSPLKFRGMAPSNPLLLPAQTRTPLGKSLWLSMLQRRCRRRLMCDRITGSWHAAQEFQLSDPADKASYLGTNDQRDTAINPCLNSTYRFIELVLKHLIDLHKVVCNRSH